MKAIKKRQPTKSPLKGGSEEIAQTPWRTKPAGKKMNFGRTSELYNRFRTICLDMAGHPMARDPEPAIERKITIIFNEIQQTFSR